MNPSTLALWEKVTEHLAPTTMPFPISRQFASELFHRTCDAAGIQLQLRQGIHSLRHSLGHHLLDQNAPLPVIQRALRHRSIGSTSVYIEADAASVDQWRAKATTSGTYAVQPQPSLAEIRKEIERLSQLAAAMAQTPESVDSGVHDAQAD